MQLTIRYKLLILKWAVLYQAGDFKPDLKINLYKGKVDD